MSAPPFNFLQAPPSYCTSTVAQPLGPNFPIYWVLGLLGESPRRALLTVRNLDTSRKPAAWAVYEWALGDHRGLLVYPLQLRFVVVALLVVVALVRANVPELFLFQYLHKSLVEAFLREDLGACGRACV